MIPALKADGFEDVEVFGPHATPDGDFPNVPKHVSNPENKEVFDSIIVRAKEIGADLVLASDPDCDRIGLAAPLHGRDGAPWATMTGNQIGGLTSTQVANLATTQVAAMTAAQINALNYTQLSAFTPEEIGVLTPGQVAGSFGLLPSGISLTFSPPAQALSSFSTTQCGCQTERFCLP